MAITATPLVHLQPISIYPGSRTITTKFSNLAYEVGIIAPTDTQTLFKYYTDEIKRHDNNLETQARKIRGSILLSDFREVVFIVYVSPLHTNESLAIIRISSNTSEPINTFVGSPNQVFPSINTLFEQHTPFFWPANRAVTVIRTTPPQPPVYTGARLIDVVEDYPVRAITYDVPGTVDHVRMFYDQRLRQDSWTYLGEEANAFDVYGMLQQDDQPAFGLNLFVVPLTSERSLVHLVMYISGPGRWDDIPLPPTPIP